MPRPYALHALRGLSLVLLLAVLLTATALSAFQDETAVTLPPLADDAYALAAGDVDADGDLDLVVTGADGPRLLLNQATGGGAGVFTESAGLPALGAVALGAVLVDVDGDADLDLFLAVADGQDRLLLNDGAGAYTDATAARLPPDVATGAAAAAGDVDGDGDTDLVVGNRDSRSLLLLNNGSGAFTDAGTNRLPVDADPTTAVLFADLDGDGADDLFFANDGAQNRLLLNDGLGTFTDATAANLPAAADESLSAAAADADGDGDIDLVIANGTAGTSLLLNDAGLFTDASASRLPALAEYAVGLAAGDIDFDGSVDLVVANAGQDAVLLNDGAGSFAVSTLPADERRSFAVLLLDADLDFDLDLPIAAPAGQTRLLVNDLAFPRIRLSLAPDYVEATETLTFAVETFDEDGVAAVALIVRRPGGTEDTPTLTAGTASYVPPVAGDYVARVTAEDSLGNIATRSLSFLVQEQDLTAPGVTTTVTPAEVLFGQSVQIAVSASDDRGVVSRRLNVSGITVPLSTAGEATYVATAVGTQTATGFARDAAGNEGSDAVTFDVRPDNTAPTLALSLGADTVDLVDPLTISTTATDNVAVVSLAITVTGPTHPDGLELTPDADGSAAYTPFLAGTHTVSVRATDPAGNETVETATFEAVGESDSTAPTVTVDVSPATVAVGNVVTVTVDATDDVAVSSRSLTINGTPVTLDAVGTATYTPPVIGDYTAEARATDPTGNATTATTTFRAIDPAGDTEPPDVALASPADSAEASGVVTIGGTADDPTLAAYSLAYAPVGTNDFTTFATGTEAVVDGTLGTLDTTLMENGFYRVRLTAEDINGRTATTERLIQVSGRLKLGIFTVSFQDKTIPVGRLPVSVTRTYDSRRRGSVGDFGYGWNVALTQAELVANRLAGDGWEDQNLGGFIPTYQLAPTQPHFVTIRLGEDKEVKFRAVPVPATQRLYPFSSYGPTGMRYAPVGDSDVGTLTASGEDPAWLIGDEIVDFGFDVYNPSRFTYTAPDGFQYIFSGSQTSVRYSLIAVVDPAGVRIDITPDGFTRSDGLAVTFVRDALGRITSIEDPAGNTVTYEYDGAGDLVAVIDAEGHRAEFEYDDEHYLTELRDPSGNPVQRNEYDEDGRLIAITDAAGNRVEMDYDLDANTQIVRDRRNNPSIYEYDSAGNVVAETRFPTVDGSVQPVLTQRRFDDNGQMTQETLPDGTVNSYAYDRFGNIIEEVRDVGGLALTTTYVYNASGRLLTETDARGNTITHTYDADGNRDSTTDREGNITLFEYSDDGLLTREIDALGNYTAYEHDVLGNVIAESRWDGNRSVSTADDTLLRRIEYDYDSVGNKVAETVLVADGSGGYVEATTSWTYDRNGRQLTETDPRGHTTTYDYDEVGNRIAEIDPLGHRTEYGHNALGDLIRIDYPDGGAKLIGYDADGNRTTVTNPNGRTTTYVYDALDRVIRVDHPDVTLADGSTQISSQINLYDAVGNLIGEVDERGNRTDHGYDAAGRRTSTLQPEVYDAVTDSLVRPQTLYEYDANGNRSAVVDAKGNRTEYSFDREDRPTGTLFADGNTTAVGYDDLGRETSRTDAAGLVTEYAYDALGRQTAVSLPPPNPGDARPETLFTYDELGNPLTQTDANGHVTAFTYDLTGNRLSRTLPGLQTETFVYDAADQMVSHTDFNGETTEFDYDARGRRTLIAYPDGTSVATTYTPGGQRSIVTDARGPTTYAYDERDRLVSRTDPDGLVIAYGYTASSEVETATTAAGTTRYGYDALDRLASVTDPDGNAAFFWYDAVGNQSVLDHANGAETRYGYNDRNQLTRVEQRDALGALFAMHVYTLDANGLRTRVDELPMGNAVDYVYDDNHRLVRETRVGADAYDIRYSYDAVGNRVAIDRDGAVTGYSYDANDRLTSSGLTTYGYDANGNLTSVTSGGQTTTFVFDAANRLVRSTAPGGAATDYVYDADGNRVLKSDTGGDTRYLVDIRNHTGVAQVLEEHAGGGPVARYTYGAQRLTQDRAGVLSHYHADGLGSVRALTDATGAVTDSYVYDGYGNEVATTGSTDNPYRFAGEPFDPNVGLYYLRARYYDAETGRFVSMDPAAGDPQSPMSLHRYLYANDNPVNFVDPTGRFTLISINISISIQSTIRSIYTKNLVSFFLTAARIAYCQLEPAYTLQIIGIDMMFKDLPGAELIIHQSRAQIAAGYRAIGNAALAVYQDTLNELVDFKVEFGGVLADVYNWANGSGGLPISVPLPQEAAEVIEFYEQLQGWFETAETAYTKAKEGIQAATSSDACQIFTFLDENADTILGKVPDF
ncbi:FG-GAP-like repeat-containing protein [Halochromatium glycolicum]|uniref:Teneurin-like YD-shell domain-containing protein n=1 Tax=Halochromatium glycolicum TaxID=85075 RepID=A0AAJ0X8H0_9GAMM|nr:hypothetical protein [Halochromatium glycolicum]